MLKQILHSTLFFLAALLIFSGCGPQKETLHLYCWADYISPDLIREFEVANNCRVVYDTFDSNEALLAKLEAGATGYDLIVPSHYVISTLVQSNLLQKLDPGKLTFLKQLDESLLAKYPDPKFDYSIPYTMSYTGIGYCKDAVKDFKPSWQMFLRKDLGKRATLLDDKREVLGAALLTLGINPNTATWEQLLQAKKLIREWMKNISKFESEQYKNGIASREFMLVMGYSGDMMQVAKENPHIGFVIPDEGCLITSDVFALTKTAPNPNLAYKFLNFLYQPENTAKNVEFTQYLCPNKACYKLLGKSILEDPAIFPPKKILDRSVYTIDQTTNEKEFNAIWEEIKAGR